MSDFDKIIDEARVLAVESRAADDVRDKAALKAIAAREMVQNKLIPIFDVCTPVYRQAIREYNSSASLQIRFIGKTSICFSDLPGHPQLFLKVRLQCTDGHEPEDRELEWKELEVMNNAVKVILDPMFKEAGIPLVFGGLNPPLGYFK